MKIEIHSAVMDNLMTPFFFESIKDFSKNLKKKDLKIDKIQFYSDFFEKNHTYPFIDGRFVYYPLTVVYQMGWEIIWICWENDLSILSLKDIPFSTLKKVNILCCNAIPNEFKGHIKGLNLYFEQKNNFVQPVIKMLSPLRHRGEISQNFIDEMAEQISSILIEIGGVELNKRWSLEICDLDVTQTFDNTNYRIVYLKNCQAECIELGVCWDSEYDTSDSISNRNIKFAITENQFDGRVKDLSSIVSFINNNGFDLK